SSRALRLLPCLLPLVLFSGTRAPRHPPPSPTRRSSDLAPDVGLALQAAAGGALPLRLGRQPLAGPLRVGHRVVPGDLGRRGGLRSEEHTSELQSLTNLVCRLLLAKKTITTRYSNNLTTL